MLVIFPFPRFGNINPTNPTQQDNQPNQSTNWAGKKLTNPTNQPEQLNQQTQLQQPVQPTNQPINPTQQDKQNPTNQPCICCYFWHSPGRPPLSRAPMQCTGRSLEQRPWYSDRFLGGSSQDWESCHGFPHVSFIFKEVISPIF